jgi:polar amino acid transport system ATP-binding protein
MRLEARALVKAYGTMRALDGASFETGDQQRVVALLGPSGGGKSTLLRVLGCLLVADGGTVLVDGKELPHDEAGALVARRGNGFVFQGYNLFPHLSALENVALPLRVVHGQEPLASEARAREMLDRLGLREHVQKRPAELRRAAAASCHRPCTRSKT